MRCLKPCACRRTLDSAASGSLLQGAATARAGQSVAEEIAGERADRALGAWPLNDTYSGGSGDVSRRLRSAVSLASAVATSRG